MGFCPRGVWVMGSNSPPTWHRLGGPKNVWDTGVYGLSQVWVMGVTTVASNAQSKAGACRLGFGFLPFRPSQKPSQAVSLARLGPAYFGSAWPGSRPEAGPSTALFKTHFFGVFGLAG